MPVASLNLLNSDFQSKFFKSLYYFFPQNVFTLKAFVKKKLVRKKKKRKFLIPSKFLFDFFSIYNCTIAINKAIVRKNYICKYIGEEKKNFQTVFNPMRQTRITFRIYLSLLSRKIIIRLNNPFDLNQTKKKVIQ